MIPFTVGNRMFSSKETADSYRVMQDAYSKFSDKNASCEFEESRVYCLQDIRESLEEMIEDINVKIDARDFVKAVIDKFDYETDNRFDNNEMKDLENYSSI